MNVSKHTTTFSKIADQTGVFQNFVFKILRKKKATILKVKISTKKAFIAWKTTNYTEVH